MLSCGIAKLRWLSMALPCGIGWDEMNHWMIAIWQYSGAHLSGDLCQGGAHMGDVVQ
jgi:hypothetical protein